MEMRDKSRCSVARRIEYPRYSYEPSILYDGYGTISSCYNNKGLDATDWSYDANDAPVWEQFLSIGDQKSCANVKNHKRKKQEAKQRLLRHSEETISSSGYSSSKENSSIGYEVDILKEHNVSRNDTTLPSADVNTELQVSRSLQGLIFDETETESSQDDQVSDCVLSQSVASGRAALQDSISSSPLKSHVDQDQTVGAIAIACLNELSSILGDTSDMTECLDLSNSLNSLSSETEERLSTSPPRSLVLLKSNSAPSLQGSSLRIMPRSAMKRCASTDVGGKIVSTTEGTTSDEYWKRSVSFSNLHIREYTSVEISDNPSCSNGPPIQLGWEYRDQIISVDVDKYEEHRSPRKTLSQMLLPYHVRRYLLLYEGGYSNAEVSRATREVERVKQEKRKKLKQVVSSTSSDVKLVRKYEDDDEDESHHPFDHVVGFLRSVFKPI